MSLRERDGWRSWRNAFASDLADALAGDREVLAHSRRVCSEPSPRPKGLLMTLSARGQGLEPGLSLVLQVDVVTASATELTLLDTLRISDVHSTRRWRRGAERRGRHP